MNDDDQGMLQKARGCNEEEEQKFCGSTMLKFSNS